MRRPCHRSARHALSPHLPDDAAPGYKQNKKRKREPNEWLQIAQEAALAITTSKPLGAGVARVLPTAPYLSWIYFGGMHSAQLKCEVPPQVRRCASLRPDRTPGPSDPRSFGSGVGGLQQRLFNATRGPTKRIVDGWPPGNTRLLQVMRAQLAALRRYSVERVAMVQWWEGHDWTRPRPGLRTRPRQNNCSLWVRAAPRAAAGHGALCSNEVLPTPTVEH